MSTLFRIAVVFGIAATANASTTLADAIVEARIASPDARIACLRVEQAEALRRMADSSIKPRIELTSAYMQTNSPMNAFGAILNTGTFDNSINFNKPGQTDVLSNAISIKQPIYTWGRISGGRSAAKAGLQAAEYDRLSALRRLDVEVVRSFFSIRQAQQSVLALDAALGGYDESLRVARLREEAGQLLKSERLNLEVQRARTESQLLAARQMVDLSRAMLATALGRRSDSGLELADDDGRLIQHPLSTVAEQWPELSTIKAQVSAAEHLLHVAKAARRPTIGAFASVQDNRGWRRDGDGQNWTAGVAVGMTIYDGAETDARIAEAQAKLEQALEAERKVQLALELRLRQARINHEVSLSQLEVCRKQVEQAGEAAQLSRERFAAGSLLSAELIGVETRLADARVQLAQSLAQERIAVAELRSALGLEILGN